MIEIIAAISQNNCIGKQGKIPWHISEDLKRVKQYTTGKVVVMGRHTWESIPQKFRPLSDRVNVIISSRENLELPPNVECFTSIDEALRAHASETIIGFGGQRIYESLIDQADTLYITHVPVMIEDGDAFFPQIDPLIWREHSRETI